MQELNLLLMELVNHNHCRLARRAALFTLKPRYPHEPRGNP